MISNAMFYRQDTQATTNKAGVLMKIGPIEFTLTQLWISFIGTLIVLPVNLIIVTLFRKAKYSQKTLITHHMKESKRKNKPFGKDEQYEKTSRFVFVFLLIKLKFNSRFFSRAKLRLTHSKKVEEDEVERIAAIPSVEDKTRTLPHWIIYIAWACKINKHHHFFEKIFFFSSGYIEYLYMFIFYHSLFIRMGC
jgi:hypothetical protein